MQNLFFFFIAIFLNNFHSLLSIGLQKVKKSFSQVSKKCIPEVRRMSSPPPSDAFDSISSVFSAKPRSSTRRENKGNNCPAQRSPSSLLMIPISLSHTHKHLTALSPGRPSGDLTPDLHQRNRLLLLLLLQPPSLWPLHLIAELGGCLVALASCVKNSPCVGVAAVLFVECRRSSCGAALGIAYK